MDLRFYPAVIVAVDGARYGVIFPDLPDCVASGPNVTETAHRAVEALRAHLTNLAIRRVPAPKPSLPDAALPDWIEDASVVVRVMVPA